VKIRSSARNSNLINAHDTAKMGFQVRTAPWDMDFKGHWEMDHDLIGEFIEQQQQDKISKIHSNDAKFANQAERVVNELDEAVLMMFLPMKLMDDANGNIGDSCGFVKSARSENSNEAQSISSLKSKFDANVKALWNDVDHPLTKPLSNKSFENDTSLASSFTSEKNSLNLFNFNGYQPQPEAIGSCSSLQMYSKSNTDFMNIADFKTDNNLSTCRTAVYKNHPSSTSPGAAEKFIKSGTNLQSSIWSEGEFALEPECLIYKDVSDTLCFMVFLFFYL
jgi:hypothetical protein